VILLDRRNFLWGSLLASAVPASVVHGQEGQGKDGADDPRAKQLEELAITPQAPAIGLADLEGHVHEAEGFLGKVVVLAFWASWCAPCRREMPALQNLRARLRPDNIDVIAVNYGEKPQEISRFLRKVGVSELPVLLDADEEMAKRWYVGVLPIAYALDRKGVVRLGIKGEVDWDSTEIDAQLRALAAES